MLYILLALLGILVLLLGIAVVRTIRLKAPAAAGCDTVITKEECAVCANKLTAMVQVPTVSKREDEDLSLFYQFHDVLQEQFPLLHRHLEKTVLSGTLLYRWPGTDGSKKPILLMGHQDVVPGMDRPYAVIGITEKGNMDLKITARGKGGHSSTPPRCTPAARLFAFANEIERKRPFRKALLPEAEEMFRQMAPSLGFGLRLVMGNIWLF